MNNSALLIATLLLMPAPVNSRAQAATGASPSPAAQEKTHVTQHAAGTFEVKMAPQKPDNEVAQAANIGRFSSDKVFHGDLEATSKGEMLAAGDPKVSAGYVAMERVTGSLKGRKGSFVLQHSGTMTRGVPALSITVVPDSGTEELKGLSGKMKIIIAADGKHSYEFDYSLE
ncbi:MAG TPA: DUF3224 domain-containing protein [Candidatus Angelobacter sp.]|nr:DUF3224 domain-containing protein [Candidatus Angelobacter sp.]